MQAEIIAVGSELLTSQRLDTNSLYLTDELNALGVEVVTKCVVGDDRDRLADSIRRAFQSVQIVIITGGLGPTEDDVTRDAVAQALGRKLNFHAEIAGQLEQLIAPVYKKYENPVTTILAAAGDIQVHLRARCGTEAEAVTLLAEVAAPIEQLLGDRIYSRNGEPMEVVVGELLRQRMETISVAE